MAPWTDRELVFPPSGGEMAALMRDQRWEATPLGPVEHWSGALRAAVRMMLTSRVPMWIGWGDQLTFLYNDAYRAGALGTKHPWALGAQASEVWSEIWPEIGPRIARALTEGCATWDPGLRLLLERNGCREETYHALSYSPLHEDDGRVGGVLCVVTEDTGRVIGERRLGLLGELAARTAGARTCVDLFAGIERGLAADVRDLPFTLTYLFEAGARSARLVAQTGFGAGAEGVASVGSIGEAESRGGGAPDGSAGGAGVSPVGSIDLDAALAPASPWPLDQIAQTGLPVDVELAAGSWPTGPWSEPPSHALVVPIPRQGQARPAGAFIAGLSPHRVLDAAYREFIALLAGQIAAGLAGAEACEAGARHAESLARAGYLQTIFEQAPVAIAILREPGHVFEFVNQHYLKIIGDREVVGRPVAEAIPEVVSQGLIELLDRVAQTGEPFLGHSVPIQLQRTQGGPLEESYFDLTFQALFDESGAVIGIAGIAHEVTALATARRDAETANRAKDEFLAMLGHELRNPLAPIMTALELMRLRPGVGTERERAVIERQVHHLVGLIDDLLDVSRITRGKVELRAEPVEVGDVIARSIEVVSPLLEEHRHTLATDVASGLLVHGDPTRLAQIVSNLLTNAAKYTPGGGRIAVRAWRDADRVLIRVTDNGIGIEPAMLPRVFEPFAQSRQAIDRAQGGLGLGLAIVDSLVKLHGGTVTARSDGRGRGSEFTVSLPLLASAPSALGVARPRRRVSASEARILIVDDNVDAAQLLADVLSAGGYHTVAAYDGPSALQAAGAFRPQVAVVDLGLPVMDGFELARLVLADPQLSQTKLVALTGYGQAEDRIRTAAAGFEAHLVKPVDIEQLRSVIERLLTRPIA